MTEWLLQEALAIRLESVQALSDLHDHQRSELAAVADELRRDAAAALDAA